MASARGGLESNKLLFEFRGSLLSVKTNGWTFKNSRQTADRRFAPEPQLPTI
jgi:hypothetical protein